MVLDGQQVCIATTCSQTRMGVQLKACWFFSSCLLFHPLLSAYHNTSPPQAEPRAQLSLASRSASNNLKISPQDLILYSAKVRRNTAPAAALAIAPSGAWHSCGVFNLSQLWYVSELYEQLHACIE